jgi:AcrR family transcriptional regulator
VVETTRRREIDDVASSLFRERGYSGTSVRDIARALDIQGASLYAHVTSKQDVLWSIVERTASRFEASADAAQAACSPPNDSHASRLAALTRAHVTVVTDDIERASVFVHEWRALTGERRTQIARRRDAYELRFRSVITDGMAAGTFRNADPTVTAAFILTSLNGIATWYHPDGRVAPSDVADTCADMVVRSVQVRENGKDGVR